MSDNPASPASLTATALLEHYRRKTLSPVEATKAVLARIAALNPSLNAFLLVDEEARWPRRGRRRRAGCRARRRAWSTACRPRSRTS